MNEIIKDLNNPHWWFNLVVAVLIIALGFVVTEFLIKPLGRFTKTYRSKYQQQIKDSDAEVSKTVFLLKKDQRQEMRLLFNLSYVRQQISLKLFLFILIIPCIASFIFIEFWPMKIALVGLGLWFLINNILTFVKLMRTHNYFLDIWEKVQAIE